MLEGVCVRVVDAVDEKLLVPEEVGVYVPEAVRVPEEVKDGD